MNSSTTKTIPKVSTAKNHTAADDGRRHSSTEDVVNNNVSSKNLETVPIREDTVQIKINDISCKMENSVPDTNIDDEDDDYDLMDIRVPSGMILLEGADDSEILAENMRPTAIVSKLPAENLEVDDRAILNCWDITVTSHDAATTVIPGVAAATAVLPSLPSQPSTLTKNDYRWQAKDLVAPSSTAESSSADILKNWQPKSLDLPPWAVDPFEMSFIIDRTKITKDDTEQHQKRMKR